MTTEAFLERRLGDHLLVAQLSEDCLGTVFRGLYSNDDNRFLRLRILQSPELSPPEVFEAVRKNARWVSGLSHKAIVCRAELGIADGIPFVAWQESAGWTLDLLLAKLRAAGMQLPVEHALLIAERVAAALEHAWSSPVQGERIGHGLLWPGFVSISNDAEIRAGGFGLAEAVLPLLRKGRLARDIAPYIAPEVRKETANNGAGADIYSLGILLHELLTCRRPTLGAPLADFRSSDPFPPEIRPILERCFAAPEDRFASAIELHRALLELLATTSYYSVSTVSLALFLYKLLNPESRSLPVTDAESTNPVEGDLPATAPLSPVAPRRRAGDRLEESSAPLFDLPESEDLLELFGPSDAPSERKPPASPPLPVRSPARKRQRAAIGLAVAIAAGVALWSVGRGKPNAAVTMASIAPSAMPDAAAARSPLNDDLVAPTLTPLEHTIERARFRKTADAAPPLAARRPRTRSSVPPDDAPAEASILTSPEQRRSVESLRLEAGIARIEAERLEASQLAADQFTEARTREREGEELFHSQSYVEALAAFDRATGLYRQAESISRERRVERLKVASN